MNNTEVIKKFLDRKVAKTTLRDIPNDWHNRYKGTYKGRTLVSTGRELINYNTIMAYFTANGKLMINGGKYSPTTSTIQRNIAFQANLKGIEFEKYGGGQNEL